MCLCAVTIAAQHQNASSLALRYARESYEYAQAGDLKSAEERMRAAIAAMPANPMLYSGLGGILRQSGRIPEARDAFARAVELDPANPIFRLQLAERLWELGDLPRAAHFLDEISSQSPQYGAAQLLGGLISSTEGDCTGAIAKFERAPSLLQKRPDAMQALASCYLQTDDLDHAAAILDKLVGDGVTTAGLQRLVARLHTRRDQPQEAMEAFEAALAEDSQNEGLFLEFGAFLARQARYHAGIAVAESAVKTFPDSARCLEMLGYFQWKRHENIAAVKSYSSALRLDPDSPEVLAGLGIAQTEAGMIDNAEATLTGALDHFPEHAMLRQSLGVLLQLRAETGTGTLDKAVEMFESAIRLDPALAESRYRLGMIALERGQVTKALVHLEHAASVGVRDSRVHYALYRAYRRAGRSDDAASALSRFQSIKQSEDEEGRKLVIGASERP